MERVYYTRTHTFRSKLCCGRIELLLESLFKAACILVSLAVSVSFSKPFGLNSMAQLQACYECCEWGCAAEFVYQCSNGVLPDDQADLRVALFDHRQYGSNIAVVDAAIDYIESMRSNYFYVVIALKPCHYGQKKEKDDCTIKRQLLHRFLTKCNMDLQSPSMKILWRNKSTDGNGKVVNMLCDEIDAKKMNLEMGRNGWKPLDACVDILNEVACLLGLTRAEKCFGHVLQSNDCALVLICIPSRELMETVSLRQALAEFLPHVELPLMTFSAGSGREGAASITYGSVSMSDNVTATVLPDHCRNSMIAGRVKLGQPMPCSEMWQRAGLPSVELRAGNRKNMTDIMPVMMVIDDCQPSSSSERCQTGQADRSNVNKVCQEESAELKETAAEIQEKAMVEQRKMVEAEIQRSNAEARAKKQDSRMKNGLIPNLLPQSTPNASKQQLQKHLRQQQEESAVDEKKQKKRGKKKVPKQQKSKKTERGMCREDCMEVDRLNKEEGTVVTRNLDEFVTELSQSLKSLDKHAKRCNKYHGPSKLEQELAIQIQSGAQRGEKMRREVQRFAEGTMEKTAAEVFANAILQRILNPMTVKEHFGGRAPRITSSERFANAFIDHDWRDELLTKVKLNTVLAAMRSSCENTSGLTASV